MTLPSLDDIYLCASLQQVTHTLPPPPQTSVSQLDIPLL